MKIGSTVAGLIFAAALSSSAHAGVVYAGPTAPMPTDQSFSVNFFSGAATTTALSFTIDGYATLDGQNGFEDDLLLILNGNPIFLGTFNLGGGSNTTQAVAFFNPFGASFTNPTNNGTGVGRAGGEEDLSFNGLPLLAGNNTLTFVYSSLTAPAAGFQGLGDEGWSVANVNVSAVPEPSTWAMMVLGLCGLGFVANRRRARAVLAAS